MGRQSPRPESSLCQWGFSRMFAEMWRELLRTHPRHAVLGHVSQFPGQLVLCGSRWLLGSGLSKERSVCSWYTKHSTLNLALLRKTGLRFLKEFHVEFPHDPAISLTGVDPRELETAVQTKTCTRMFRAALAWRLNNMLLKNQWVGTCLVVQWLRIHLPMQGTRVQALVREDPTCRRTTKPVHHNY